MEFLWPTMLWLLLILPLLLLVYWLAQRRRRSTALHYPALSLVREAMGAGQRIRRHIPPLLCFIGLAALLLVPFAIFIFREKFSMLRMVGIALTLSGMTLLTRH